MKKRYLAMLMAVVMCLSFGITGALAAEETELPAETGEQAQPSATPETTTETPVVADNVPQPLSYTPEPSQILPLDASSNPSSQPSQDGLAIAGYGGTVRYDMPPYPTDGDTTKVLDKDNKKIEKRWEENTNDLYLPLSSSWTAGTHNLTVSIDYLLGGSDTYDISLKVLSVAAAWEGGKASSEGFTLCLKGKNSETSSTPLQNAEFGLYTANPETDKTAEPVATFTTNEEGKATIALEDLAEISPDILPAIGNPNASDPNQKGGTTYYLKQLSAPEGWVCPSTVTKVFGYACWETPEGITSKLKFFLQNPGSGDQFDVTNDPLQYVYEGTDLYAWTMDNVTWDEDALSYVYDTQMLSDIDFELYIIEGTESGEERTVVLARCETDANGKATLDASDIPSDYLPTLAKDDDGEYIGGREYYLRQVSGHEVNGRTSPVEELDWRVTAAATLSADGSKFTVTLTPQDNEWGELVTEGQQQGFWVRSERYTSMSFDITKTVTVKNEGIQTGENTFNFLMAMDTFGKAQVSFTPAGGEETKPTYTQEKGSTVRLYTLPLTVDGEGTTKGTVTISGWESELMQCWIEVYELGDAPTDWEYADDMYQVTRPGYDYTNASGEPEGWRELLYDGMEMVLGHWAEIAAPAGGENTKPGETFDFSEIEYFYRGYDGKWYDSASDDFDGVTFVNTYTKAPAVVTPEATATPAPTAKPAQSPKTGDEAMPMLWLALAGVSVMGVVLVMRKKVK